MPKLNILGQIAATVHQRTWTMDSDKQALLILDPTINLLLTVKCI
jgi:hypothetical protein